MPLLIPQHADDLRIWLIKNLDAISDAEPDALASYVMELLKADESESETRSRLLRELDDFLQREAPPFVDRLLATLRSKSYLPYGTEPAPIQTFIPTGPSRGKKRGLEQDDNDKANERGARPPPKGPRLAYDKPHRGGQVPYRKRNGDWPDNNRQSNRNDNNRQDGSFSSSNERLPPQGPREMCRDYYNFGICNRGAACPFSHGEDAVTSNGLPFSPAMALSLMNSGIFPPGWQPGLMGPPMMAPAPYDPLNSQMGMQGQSRPMFPPHAMAMGMDSAVQDLTPNSRMNPNATPGQDQPGSQDADHPMESAFQTNEHNQRDGRGRGGRGGNRGGFSRNNRRNEASNDSKTLVVEKIPADKVNIADISNYFAKFGTVTNVGVDTRGAKALVSFSTNQEAHAAWSSEDAVFGNRFVSIYWHRPQPGRGVAGQKALEESAAILRDINGSGTEDTTMTDASASANPKYPPTTMSKSKTFTTGESSVKIVPKTPQELFEYATRVWLDKMKGVMEVLKSTTATESEMAEAKTKFKVLKSQKPQPPAAKQAPKEEQNSDDPTKKQNLDIDLELLASGKTEGLTQEEAQKMMARLQEMAEERGIDPNEAEQYDGASSSYRGRGRGRGWRGSYRSRGRGAAMASMRLDNRTKRVLLKGYEVRGTSDDDALQIIQSFYLPAGHADEVHKAPTGGIVVTFGTRGAAEVALRSGAPTIENLGELSVQWYNDPKPPTSEPSATAEPMNGVIHSPVANGTTTKAGNSLTWKAETAAESRRREEIENDESFGWGGVVDPHD